MKVFTPEISWHQKKPVFSVDFCRNSWKLASAGGDFTIKIWQVKIDEKEHIGLDFLSDLDRHDKAVNSVKFSPSGEFLASAGDASTDEEGKTSKKALEEEDCNKETWVVHKMLRRGHLGDIYDLAWSPDGSQLISGSIDNSAIVWHIEEGKFSKILSEHKHFVQGVCWDPRGSYYASLSSDRTCRLYDAQSARCIYSIAKTSTLVETEEGIKKKSRRLFLDEEMQLFFRRCSFSPDGSLLVIPGGFYESSGKMKKTTYVFSRKQLNKPIYHLPSIKKASTAVCFCPVIFELTKPKANDGKDQSNLLGLPYRQLFAVLSLDSVLLYDTQHYHPFGVIKHIHLSFHTDLTWSSDGRLLVISSEDGYCSIVQFSENELGTPISYNAIDYQVEKEKQAEAKKLALKCAEQAKIALDNSAAEQQSPGSVNAAKESNKGKDKNVGKFSSPNQPTLEMLVTSSRKRKRPKSTSPTTNGAVKAKVVSPSGTDLQVSLEKQSPQSGNLLSSPRSSTLVPKPPRRINLLSTERAPVITIDDGNETTPSSTINEAKLHQKEIPKISAIGKGSKKPSKMPKRIVPLPVTVARDVANNTTTQSVETGEPKALNDFSRSSEVSVQKHANSLNGTSPSIPPKVPKRASLITLNSHTSNGISTCSMPAKPAKRVQTTLLSTSGSSCEKQEENCTVTDSGNVTDGKRTNSTSCGKVSEPDTLGTGVRLDECDVVTNDIKVRESNNNDAQNGGNLTNVDACSEVQELNANSVIDLTNSENTKGISNTSIKDIALSIKAPRRVALCTLQTPGMASVSNPPHVSTKKPLPVSDTSREPSSSVNIITID